MPTMHAVRIHRFGGPDVLTYEPAPCPEPQADEVLIRVHAAGVNRVDSLVREGFLAAWFHHTLPLILGWDVSGQIAAVGASVTAFAPGDAVFARTDVSRDGAYAEYIAVRVADVAPKPHRLDHVQAAAVPHAALTAWQALFDAANLRSGQTVLIHGAAGGVGHLAVQLATWRGATVIGTASPGNLDFLRQLGVDQAIAYPTTPFEAVAREVDVVLDTIGGETQQRSWATLKRGGVLVGLVDPPSEETATAYGVQPRFIAAQPHGSQLRTIGQLVDSGQLRPTVTTVLPLQEARQAHTLSGGGHTRGKIVLRVVD